MAGLEVVLDFAKVSVEDVSTFRETIGNNQSLKALQAIRRAIISVDGKTVDFDKMRSSEANALCGVLLKELTNTIDDTTFEDVLIDLDGWYIADQDAYYRAISKNDYKELDRVLPMVVQVGPNVGSDGKWLKSCKNISFEDFVKINKAINEEIKNSFSEGN